MMNNELGIHKPCLNALVIPTNFYNLVDIPEYGNEKIVPDVLTILLIG